MQVGFGQKAAPSQVGIYNLGVTTAKKSGKSTTKQGQRLAQLRKAAGLSQRELAGLLGLPHTNIAFWEHSDKPPRSDVLPKMAQILGVRVQDLLNGESQVERRGGPTGKARDIFERLSKLPRRHREKVVEVVAALVKQYEETID